MSAVRRIVVGVHGSLGSLQALRWAADEAQERQVPLVPVIAWVPPGGDMAERSHPSPTCDGCGRRRPASGWPTRSTRASAASPTTCGCRRGWSAATPGRCSSTSPGKPGDLLVIGTGRRNPIGRALHRSVGRYCLAHARCPVLAVPPSALMDEMRHGLLPWSLRGTALASCLDRPGPCRASSATLRNAQ